MGHAGRSLTATTESKLPLNSATTSGIVQAGMEDDEKRVLARALNLARRQLNTDQKRKLIADQLKETPDKSLRWVAKMLGVHHATVGSVRGEMQSTGEISQLERTVGRDGKYRPAAKPLKAVARSSVERNGRDPGCHVHPRRLREGTEASHFPAVWSASSPTQSTQKSTDSMGGSVRNGGTA